MNRKISSLVLILALAFTPALFAQSNKEKEQMAIRIAIEEAQMALSSAENAGAPVFSRELYDEARGKLNFALANANHKKRETRETARLRAVEAKHGARAAEARSRLVTSTTEVRNLRADITRFGGSFPATLIIEDEAPLVLARGLTSADRVRFAEQMVELAKSVGAQAIAPDDMKTAEATLVTAKNLAKNKKQSQSADHLAYLAEMVARRAYYLARRGVYDRNLPGLRLQRTNLAQAASQAQALEDRRRREDAERRALELRRQLEAEAASRQLQEEELARLRQQVAENERTIRSQLEEDRLARVEAEKRVDILMSQYESALAAGTSNAEVEQLRRQLEDQSIALRQMRERERMSEQSLTSEIERLRAELERERRSGQSSVDILSERESELNRQESELARMRKEREENERRRTEAEQAYQQKIRETEQRLYETQVETEQLRQQIAAERAKVEQAQTELARTRTELSRKVSEEQERTERMQAALSAIAQTRNDERGFIITLPGIFFDTGKSTLTAGAKNVLTKIADQLKANDKLSVLIEGHTDSVGSEASNQQLSLKRSNAVRDYLVSAGIAPGRVSTEGMGEKAPVATNDTPAGRQQNRRVELVVR